MLAKEEVMSISGRAQLPSVVLLGSKKLAS